MLLRMLEENWKIDEIIFCDTGKEFPAMYEHIKQVNNFIKKDYGKEIVKLQSLKSFDYYMFNHIKIRGKNKGKIGYGWPRIYGKKNIRWCTSYLKANVMNRYLKLKYGKGNYIEYVGIAFDEQQRKKEKEYPLIGWKMTEKDCLNFCYERGFYWNGLYEKFSRVSCWCCPFKQLKELKELYLNFPKLWGELKEMDKKSYNQFRRDYSINELEVKFKKEE